MYAIETHEFSAEPVYDDSLTDYLYTKYSGMWTAVVNSDRFDNEINGRFMSYSFAGGRAGAGPTVERRPSAFVPALTPDGGVGIAEAPSTSPPRPISSDLPFGPPVTHQTIRHRLTTPRGPLYIFSGTGSEGGTPPAGGFGPPDPSKSRLILSSPTAPYDVDCKNGPIPRLLNVTAAMGDARTFLVDFAVETYVNEADENNARPFGALLSNRWKQRHAVGKDGYTTVFTEGLALFRTDLLYGPPDPSGGPTGTSPDVFRPLLFMPVPQGFVREIDYVEAREDVTGLAYGYHDTQQSVNFVAGPFVGAADITAVHRQSVTSNVDFLPTAIAVAERGLNMLLNAKWLKGERSGRPGAGTGRLMTPGVGSRPWKPDV